MTPDILHDLILLLLCIPQTSLKKLQKEDAKYFIRSLKLQYHTHNRVIRNFSLLHFMDYHTLHLILQSRLLILKMTTSYGPFTGATFFPNLRTPQSMTDRLLRSF